MSPRLLASIAVFLILPAALTTLILVREIQIDDVAVDFTDSYYPAGEFLLAGESPYSESEWRLANRTAYVYPPLTAAMVAPFTALSARTAGILWTLGLLAALAASLALVGVRDWRLYGLTLLWPATVSAIQTASVTLLLGLLCALGWQFRDRRFVCGVFLGLAIALKLFLWPLAWWLFTTRRYASAATAGALAAISTASVLLFLSTTEYVDLLRQLSDLVERDTYTLFALLRELGVPEDPTRALVLIVGGLVLFFEDVPLVVDFRVGGPGVMVRR